MVGRLLKGLFREKRASVETSGEKQVTVVLPEPHYGLFETMSEGLPDILVLNVALQGFVHMEVFPWHLRVEIQAQDIADNGMPTPTESTILDQIGDEIEQALVEAKAPRDAANTLFLLRSTWNGMRQLEFYVHNPDIADSAIRPLVDRPAQARPWQYVMREDFEWLEAARAFKSVSSVQ